MCELERTLGPMYYCSDILVVFWNRDTHVQSNNQFHKSVSSRLLFREFASDWLTDWALFILDSLESRCSFITFCSGLSCELCSGEFFPGPWFVLLVICIVKIWTKYDYPGTISACNKQWIPVRGHQFCKFNYSVQERWTDEDEESMYLMLTLLLILIQANYHGTNRSAFNTAAPHDHGQKKLY